MAQTSIPMLQANRGTLLLELNSLAVGSTQYIKIYAQIHAIDAEIHKLTEPKDKELETKQAPLGTEYNESLGTYVSTEQTRAITDLFTRKKLGAAPTDQDTALGNQFLKEDISKDHTSWYNNFQVEALTGERVTLGVEDLKSTLGNKLPKPSSFSHMILGPNNQNHFVSFDIRKNKDTGEIQIMYADSNGEIMPPAERAAIAAKFPGVEITYLGAEGQKISEANAIQDTSKLLRLQYDSFNCGNFSAQIVNMFQIAGNDTAKLQAGAKILLDRANNPAAERGKHQGALNGMAANEVSAMNIYKAGFRNEIEQGATIINKQALSKEFTSASEELHKIIDDKNRTEQLKPSDVVTQVKKTQSNFQNQKHSAKLNQANNDGLPTEPNKQKGEGSKAL